MKVKRTQEARDPRLVESADEFFRESRSDSPSDSIEWMLDMNESGPMRGDEILHSHGRTPGQVRPELGSGHPPLPDEDGMHHNYQVDMSEPNREGDEMSGDEHSAGLQGDESELENQDTVDTGLPGEETEKDEAREKKSVA